METQLGQEPFAATTPIQQPVVLPVIQPTAVPIERSAKLPEVSAALNSNITANDELSPLKEISGRGKHFSKLRSDSIIPTEGHEGILIAPKLYKGQAVAVYTSGGDASGLFYIY